MRLHTSRERTRQVIHYIIEHTRPDLGATRLCKVMWRADLHHFRRHGETISGQASYVRMPRGPVPNGFHDALHSLEKRKAIQKKPVTVFNFTRHEFHVLKRANRKWFSESAERALQEAIDAITPLRSQDASDDTHDSLWEELEDGEQMPIAAAAIVPAAVLPEDIRWARQEKTVPLE